MNAEALVLAYAVTFAYVSARVSGFVLVSPFPGEQAPVTTRVGVVVVLSLVAAINVVTPGAAPPLDLALAVGLMSDFAIGVVIGGAFRFTLSAAEVAGGALSHAIGLGTPSLMNPVSGVQDTTLGHITSAFGLLLALGVGAHRTAIAYLLQSLRSVPPGSSISLQATVPLFVELAGRSITVGVQLAMPVIALSIAVQVALAFLARAAPSLQIFSVGFALLIGLGFFAFDVSLHGFGLGMIEHLGGMPAFLDRALTDMGGR